VHEERQEYGWTAGDEEVGSTECERRIREWVVDWRDQKCGCDERVLGRSVGGIARCVCVVCCDERESV
jgi:hypothetical protein